ncbi:hypothetical protein EAH89_17355 [Roseomonas nepalensis]|uniref:Uncharacterized protein n=1 Tax=Muricoccus nepalensis TaxID=1854500 RepID=A0A502FUY8_9PROT|nr:hypothetical protein [Roseomonas nepalensis]TPG53285.1 hypothetical protein EAH89_17355 [Roseomonas nepalensis]
MPSITTANRNRAADAVTVRLNGGLLRVYTGTPPVDANTALSGNTLLAELTFGATAFAAATNGTAAANAITADSSADNTGRPTFARAFEAGGTTAVVDYRAAFSWIASTAYAIGDRVVNGGNQYRATAAGTAAASGGPTGIGATITDGGVTWAYEGVAEITFSGGPSIVQLGTVTVSSLTYTQSAS